MSEKKTTKVYLMVECEMDATCTNPDGAAVGTIAALLAHACDSETGATYSFKLWENMPAVVVHDPKVLPDDIKDILWRDKYNKMTPSQMLVALKEKWDTEAEGEDVDE